MSYRNYSVRLTRVLFRATNIKLSRPSDKSSSQLIAPPPPPLLCPVPVDETTPLDAALLATTRELVCEELLTAERELATLDAAIELIPPVPPLEEATPEETTLDDAELVATEFAFDDTLLELVELAGFATTAELVALVELVEIVALAALAEAPAIEERELAEVARELLALDEASDELDEAITGFRFDVHSIALRIISIIFGSAKLASTCPTAV